MTLSLMAWLVTHCVPALAAPTAVKPFTPEQWAPFMSAVALEVTRQGTPYDCSGILIDPTHVLTAAHCVVDADSIRVSPDIAPRPDAGTWIAAVPGKPWIHPGYDPNKSFFTDDIARVELTYALPGPFPRQPRDCSDANGLLSPGLRLERIGFGLRNGMRARTWTNPAVLSLTSEKAQSSVIVLDDAFAFPGDSGGPVYARDADGGLVLVGVHSTLVDGKASYEVAVCSSLRGD